MLPSVAYALMLGTAPASAVGTWQSRYETLVWLMRQGNVEPVARQFHPDYSEVVDGKIVGLAEVRKQLTERMQAVAEFGQAPVVLKVKQVGNTVAVDVRMTYRAVRDEDGRKAVYVGRSVLSDTWLKVGSGHKLYRSTLVSTVTTRDGKVVTPPAASQ